MALVNMRESESTESNLVTRLDPAIGEASAGIGLVLSELVRRSLRSGVAEIDQTIHALAAEKVDIAVAEKMAEVTDAAEQVSRRVSEMAVRKVAEETEQVRSRTNHIAERTERVAEQATQAAEHLSQSIHSAVDRFGAELGETQRQANEMDRTLQSLREKARQSWRKLRHEMHGLKDTNALLNQLLLAAQKQLKAAEDRVARIELEVTERQRYLDAVLARCESQEKRLIDLERPRGISALIQRFRGKSQPKLPSPSAENTPEEGEEPTASA